MFEVKAPQILQGYLQGLAGAQAIQKQQDDQQAAQLYKQVFAKTQDYGKAMHSAAETLFQHGLVDQGVAAAKQAEQYDFNNSRIQSALVDSLVKQETAQEKKVHDAAQAQHWNDMTSAMRTHYAEQARHWDQQYETQALSANARFLGIQETARMDNAKIKALSDKAKYMLGMLDVKSRTEQRLSQKQVDLNRQGLMAYRAAYPMGKMDASDPDFFTFVKMYKNYVKGVVPTSPTPQQSSILKVIEGLANNIMGGPTPGAAPKQDYKSLWGDGTNGSSAGQLPPAY